MNNDKYLPLGSVVMLQGGKKRIMIAGFLGQTTSEEEKVTIYDYIGCLYPEGLINSEKNLLFNHDQIERVDAVGFSDEEEKNFKKRLSQIEGIVLSNKTT